MRRYRLFVVPALGLAGLLTGFLFYSISDDLVYYKVPAEMVAVDATAPDVRMRLGGQVLAGSVAAEGDIVSFVITDGHAAVHVAHRGTPQQLFREGIGVVVEGRWDGRVFHSDTMIIKHDEQYRTEDGGVYTPDSRTIAP